MLEDWRDIPGYNGAYQISPRGEVRSWRYRGEHFAKNPKILTQYKRGGNRPGHRPIRFVKLTTPDGKAKDWPVLRLMVLTWYGGCPEGKVPYHKNGDLNDHSLHNIGFITRRELGKKTGAKAKRIAVKKISPSGEVVAFYPSARAAAKANHMSYQSVIDRCNGKVKKPFALDGHNYQWDN